MDHQRPRTTPPRAQLTVDLTLILIRFIFGFGANTVKLPPLVGYLVAGFVLRAFGYEVTDAIELLADVGVLLLLFGIGLKLRLTTLARPAVWAGASIHAATTTALISGLLLGLGALGLPLAAGLSGQQAALVGFAFSFSSTVCAVKALEERNEATSLRGRLAVGILVVQDIFAVVFLTLTVETPRSIWAYPCCHRCPCRQACIRMALGQGWPWRTLAAARLSPGGCSWRRILLRGRA